MFYRWGAATLVLALCVTVPKPSAAQARAQRVPVHGTGRIAGNTPNPFTADTHILFAVGDTACIQGSGRHVVTMRILNVLAQPVVIPRLEAGVVNTTTVPQSMQVPIAGLTLACGSYSAYWDGKLPRSGRSAAPGVYAVQLLVDKDLVSTIKIYHSK